ncbi:hypothetical protein HYFRA_00000625 [Hymenoscyphus fraxineus]|uniref:Uncharacterized protein n=1 Tax=Hymenoscyphus fraxineus TaxID=746836 RepID=A0A9N9L155_9HELO|nr:hypothetical protein HYFRA_00000625 [Hymenoscyphus fraxineus]
MPPKGSSALTPMRLPPLPKLRVRLQPPAPFPAPTDQRTSMLGIIRIQRSRLRSSRNTITDLYGHACKPLQTPTTFRPNTNPNPQTQRPKIQKKNTINHHLSRMYPKISGPRKRK